MAAILMTLDQRQLELQRTQRDSWKRQHEAIVPWGALARIAQRRLSDVAGLVNEADGFTGAPGVVWKHHLLIEERLASLKSAIARFDALPFEAIGTPQAVESVVAASDALQSVVGTLDTLSRLQSQGKKSERLLARFYEQLSLANASIDELAKLAHFFVLLSEGRTPDDAQREVAAKHSGLTPSSTVRAST
ncbi:hypothetical protein [Pseudacidovorax sp. NFM-22]|uniref:hypothetical protein n=1 Tax=Pseudacidovorax sp. NFM-22 TaxID=2744469 RepID=UPI001F405226|nr:hypothetical protein [Pseudacidovorax sp. NFM-22]